MKRGHWAFVDRAPWFMQSYEMMTLQITWFKLVWVNTEAKYRIQHRREIG